jgi:hypothetical protein
MRLAIGIIALIVNNVMSGWMLWEAHASQDPKAGLGVFFWMFGAVPLMVTAIACFWGKNPWWALGLILPVIVVYEGLTL